jgi:hypothetical protein
MYGGLQNCQAQKRSQLFFNCRARKNILVKLSRLISLEHMQGWRHTFCLCEEPQNVASHPPTTSATPRRIILDTRQSLYTAETPPLSVDSQRILAALNSKHFTLQQTSH